MVKIAGYSFIIRFFIIKVLGELERRGLREEGVLRVAGNRQKVESLISHLDRDFYSRPELIDHLLACSTVHELTSLLKRLLRSLPQPLLTPHLLHLFYLSHSTFLLLFF